MDFNKKIDRLGTNSIKWDRYKDKEVIAMGTADMDFLSPECVSAALSNRAQKGIFGYELKSSLYYQSIIEWNIRRFEWPIDKKWISNSPGIWAGIRICVDTFSEVGDKILVHSPTFHPINEIVKQSGRQLISSELQLKDGKYTIDFVDFENRLKSGVRIFILVNPHNPTGRVFTLDELTRIGKLCNHYGVLVISDEVYGPIVFHGSKHIPYASISDEFALNSILITGVSKTFNLQGLTHAIIIIPNAKLREHFNKALKGYDFDFATNIFSLAAVESVYMSGDIWLNELINYLETNLDYLVNFFTINLPKLKLFRPEGSYMAWIDCSELNLDFEGLEKFFIQEAKVAPTFGKVFGSAYEGFVRINFACPVELLEEALNRIHQAILKL